MSDASKKKWCDEKLHLVYVNGLPVPAAFESKHVEDSLDYVPEDNDIIICSYPKTGTTWLSYIIWKIFHKNQPLSSLYDITMKLVPFMERTGTEIVKSMEPPRTYKHHFPYNYMKVNKNAKYIYTHRNPMDTTVSYYHFNKNVAKHYGFDYADFDYFFDRFMEGKVAYGDFFDHVLQYYEHRNDSHLLLICYEDLHRNKRKEILKIAKFLGENYYQELVEDEALIQDVIAATEFNFMKQNVNSRFTEEKGGQTITSDSVMFRKGIIGDSKNLMKPEQMQKLKDKMLQKVKHSELLAAWST